MSITEGIPQGNPVKISVTFLDASKLPIDPASNIMMEVIFPDQEVSNFVYPGDLTRESAGKYSIVVAANEVGSIRAQGSGKLANGLPVTTPPAFQRVYSTGIV